MSLNLTRLTSRYLCLLEIESVDPVYDFCLTNQIYSVLLNAFEFKEITEVQNASRRCRNVTSWLQVPDTTARLLKYYPRPPSAPSFIKSRIPHPLQRHFLLFQQIFFNLVCIHAGNPRVPQMIPRGQNPAGAIKRVS